MQAVLIRQTEDPAVLSLEEAERPEPAVEEVLLRVRAASVNPVDLKFRRGIVPRRLPAVLGQDVSGTVEISRAEGYAAGDEVFGFVVSGGYAEFATASVAAVAKKPAEVSH
jgi:NADPH:quinone reductase-like Zn-dependent oxidoreductase